MRCADFKKYIYEFIEDELEDKLKDEMTKHIESCLECQERYKQKEFIQSKLALVFHTSNIEFNSSRSIIMERVREGSNKPSIIRRTSYNLKSNWMAYVSAAAVIMLIVILPKVSFNGLKKSTAMDSTGSAQKPAMENSIKQDSVNFDKEIGIGEKANSSYTDIKVEGNKEKINAVLEELKKEAIGAVPPQIVYANEENVAFYNDNHFLLYKNTKTSKGIYSIVELKDLNLGHMQGSAVIDIKASPNGQYYIIQSSGVAADILNSSVYLVDMINKRSKVISLDSKEAKCSFSSSSDYLIIGDLKDRALNLYNLKDWSLKDIKLDNLVGGWMDNIYLSKKNDVFIRANSNMGYILRKYNNYYTKEITSQEELLGATSEGFIIYKNGSLYIQGETSLKKLIDIGENCNFIQANKENIVFNKENKAFIVYSIESNKLYEFNAKKLKDITTSGKLEFNLNYTLMKLDSPTIIDGNGDLINLPEGAWLSRPVLLNDGVAYIEFSNEMKLGKFTIYKQDLINKRKVILYDTTK